MSPYEIGILLWYHCRPTDHEDIQRNPPVWRPTIERFIADELLVTATGDTAYAMTERGHAYVRALCSVPLPEHAWIVKWPHGVEA